MDLEPAAWFIRRCHHHGFRHRFSESEALRRLFVNASLWCAGLEGKIPRKADINLVGSYHPRSFLDEQYDQGIHPLDLQ
jgi:hypothetical protein